MAEFEDKLDWERYWYGPEFTDCRVLTSGWYQVPVLYVWNDVVVAGALNGQANGNGAHAAAATEEA